MSRRFRRDDHVGGPNVDVRRRIVQEISTEPGIHLRELERRLAISLSGIIHHLKILEGEDVVVGISDGHYRRYFAKELILPTEARRLTDDDRRFLAQYRRPMSLAIVLNLAVAGRLRHVELRERIGKSKSKLSYHLSRLATSGHVRLVHEASSETYELTDKARVVALLVTFSDTLRDHVDEFAKLWIALQQREDENTIGSQPSPEEDLD